MPAFVESIKPVEGQSFRLLSWSEDVEQLRLHAGVGHYYKISGLGNRWHRHPEIELTLVSKVEGLSLVGDCLRHFDSGDLVLLGRNLPHYWQMKTKSAGFSLQFDPLLPGSVWQSPECRVLSPLWQKCLRGLQISGRLAQKLRSEIQTMPDISPIARLSRLIDIMSLISDAPNNYAKPLASCDFHLPEPEDPYCDEIAMAVKTITTRYKEALRLEDVLAQLRLSRATFSRHFKRSTGKSFSNFLTEVRIGSICQSLLTSARNISDIAYDSGFNDLSFFNRTFRRMTGHSPRDWRRKNLANRKANWSFPLSTNV